MNEIDWSQAPEGADKYNTHNNLFYKGERPDLQVFIHEKWMPSAIIKSNELFVYRPSTPSWSGEGLPPVGVVCEVDWCEEWHKCEVIAHFQQRCGMVAAFTVEISDGAKSLDAFGADSFRPIRTPEQIAADEREAAIDAMLAATPAPGSDISLRVCAALYDAGYRKP